MSFFSRYFFQYKFAVCINLGYDLEDNLIREWESATQIQRELGFNNSNIGACCLGKVKTSYKYIWRFKEE